jgi:hypothetical protein
MQGHVHLPPDPLTGKALLQDDLRDHHPTQGDPGSQDRAVEPQYRRDHLQQNPHMLGFTQSTGYAILCIPKGKYNRWTRRHMPKTMKLTGNTSPAELCGEKGHIFINERTGKRLTLRHFEKMIDKWAGLLNIQRRQSIKPSGREYHLITLMGPKGGRIKAP